ncbi:MAG: hypothetical protein WBH36_06120, partial [Syntrophobacteria bacterium]
VLPRFLLHSLPVLPVPGIVPGSLPPLPVPGELALSLSKGPGEFIEWSKDALCAMPGRTQNHTF